VETAPFQLRPTLEAPESRPLKVWKHNHLGVTSWYPLDTGSVNPKNRDLDAFNNHVTAGWVAVGDGRRGLLIAEDASVTAGMAFAPMRLVTDRGRQRVRINPFGTYHGRQPDRSHLEGDRIGTELCLKVGAQFAPGAPSFNGRRLAFSLLLAPYAGSAPPGEARTRARAFFYPPGVLYRKTPLADPVLFPEQMKARIRALRARTACAGPSASPAAPDALAVTPGPGFADLVWNAPEDPCVTGFEVFHKDLGASGWTRTRTGVTALLRISGLDPAKTYRFKVRALGPGRASPFSGESVCDLSEEPRDPVKEEWIRAFARDPLFGFKLIRHLIHYYATTALAGAAAGG